MKINLDQKYDEWRNLNIQEIIDRWENIKDYKFEEFVNELWIEYQEENNLIDETNTSIDEFENADNLNDEKREIK